MKKNFEIGYTLYADVLSQVFKIFSVSCKVQVKKKRPAAILD